MARSDPQINVRLPEAIKIRLESEAVRAGRSFTQELAFQLEDALRVRAELEETRQILREYKNASAGLAVLLDGMCRAVIQATDGRRELPADIEGMRGMARAFLAKNHDALAAGITRSGIEMYAMPDSPAEVKLDPRKPIGEQAREQLGSQDSKAESPARAEAPKKRRR